MILSTFKCAAKVWIKKCFSTGHCNCCTDCQRARKTITNYYPTGTIEYLQQAKVLEDDLLKAKLQQESKLKALSL
ncbi:MAG: hypothetical protein ACJAYB_001558 [Psychromonas sp.]|jgi:hypothetical protein